MRKSRSSSTRSDTITTLYRRPLCGLESRARKRTSAGGCDNLSQAARQTKRYNWEIDTAIRPRILVVEDDPDLRRALVRHLEREGCEVSDARDGVDAMEKL